MKLTPLRSCWLPAFLVVSLGSSCTSDTPDGQQSAGGPSGSASSVPVAVVSASLVGVDPADLPALPTSASGMPEAIPPMDAELPSLLDDLPGRAVAVVNPDAGSTYFPLPVWSDFDLLFFGIDGRWRRLSMEDLGFPASSIFSDTFGSGALSSDGRWWAGPFHDGWIALDLLTGEVHRVFGRHPGQVTWVPGRHAILTHGAEITVPGGAASRVPYSNGVGYQPDGTPLSLVRGADGRAVLVEWRGSTRHPRAVVRGAQAPRRAIPPDAIRRVYKASELTAVAPTDNLFATAKLRGPNRLTVVVADSATGDTIGELTWDTRAFPLTYRDTWLDDKTLLVATAPYFIAWRPMTGELFRVTDARSTGDAYWEISVAAEALAR